MSVPLASIVVLTYNGLEHTRRCLESLERHTPEPHELILVDNASRDGTAALVQEWAAERPHAIAVLNHDNLGFAAGNNLGLALARGRFVVIANNDTVVTAGWLGRMIDVLERHPEAGLVGPRSNYVSGEQLVAPVDYRDGDGLDAFAAGWCAEHREQDTETLRLVGFCLAIRREVIERVGALDERFGRGNFEDDDFCLRAQAAGFKARIAHDSFVHHVGGQGFVHARVDYRQAMEQNWCIFKAKWGIAPDRPVELGCPARLCPPPAALAHVPLPLLRETHVLAERAWQQLPGHDPAELAAAEAACVAGEWQLAAARFSRVTERDAACVPAWLGLARARLGAGDSAAAGVALERARALDPPSLEHQLQLGVTLCQAERWAEGNEQFTRVLRRQPDNLDALLSSAAVMRAGGKRLEAVELLDRAHRAHPREPDVIAAVAVLALELGDKQSARHAWRELCRLAPTHPQAQPLAAAMSAP